MIPCIDLDSAKCFDSYEYGDITPLHMAASIKTVCINPRHLQEAHWRTDHIGACRVNGLTGQAIAT